MNYLKKEFYQILKSDENFFDFIQLNAFDGLWFWNLENSTDKWINPKFCNLLGYEYEELQGNQIQKIVHQDDQTKMQAVFDKYIKNSQSVHEDEIRFLHKKGKTVWLKLKALVFDKKESKKHRVVVTHTDITKQHKLENALDRYESILDNHSIFIIRTDIHGNYSYINNHFCERLNLDKEKIMGESAFPAIIKADHQKKTDAIHACYTNPHQSIFVQLRKPFFDKKTNQFTDNFIYTDWEYRAVLDKQGEIKEIQCVGIEVTEKVIAQQKLHAKAYELEASEEELRLNIEQLEESQSELLHIQKLLETCNEAAQIGIWELNLDNFITKVDKVTKQIHEVDENFIWSSENALHFYTKEYKEIVIKVFTRALEEGVSYDEQVKISTAKGNNKWVRIIGIPTFQNGKCIKMHGAFQDITNQKKAELELHTKAYELEASEEELRLNIEQLEDAQYEIIHTQKLLDASNEAAHIGTWELNLGDSTVKWNKVTKEIHEVENDFVCNVDTAIHFYKEGYSQKIITQAFNRAVQEGIPYDEQLKIITAKGNEIWIRAIGIPTFENGKCVELYGTFQDIDKQKTNEINLQEKLKELKLSQKQLLSTSKLLETCNASATIGTWAYNINTRDIIWDTIVHNIHELPKGIELDTLAKINFLKKGGSREKLIQVIKEAQDKGKPFDEELELISFRNNHKWIRVIGIPQTKNGRCIELYGTFQDITPQKQAELQLKQKVEELQQTKNDLLRIQKLLDTTNDIAQIGTWEIDLRTSNIKWNKVTKKIHEVDEDLVIDITKGIYYYKEGEDRKRITEAFNNAVEKGIPYDEELRIITAKGNEVWVRTIGIPVIENGIVVELYGAFHNINEQKSIELQLKQKVEELEEAQKEINKIQNQLSTTLEKTGVGLWEINLQTNKVYWDNQLRKMLGAEDLQEEALEKVTKFNYINQEDSKRINELLKDFISSKITNYHVIYQTVPIHGKVKFHESKAILIKDKNNIPISILGITQDITQQKESEKIIEEQNNELALSETELRKGIREMYHLQQDLAYQKQQLEQIFDAVPALIYQFKRDKEGNVSFPLISKGAELVLGIKPEKIARDSSSDIFEAIHPEDLLGFQSSVQKSADTMQKWESELRLLKNGIEVWIHATSKPSHTDDGGIVWTGIMQNIDQLKATELKIQKQNKELQETLNELKTTQSQLIHNEKMTTLGQLVASIAHEINTPLGAIRSSATSIERMLNSSLTVLSKIVKLLSEEQLENFNLLIKKSLDSNHLYSSREKRRIKYELIDSLDVKEIPQSDRISDILVDIGIHQETELYEPFIKHPNAVQILEAAYQLSTIAKSNDTVRIATEKASKIITTLKNFSRQDHTGEKQPTNINESLQNTLVLYHNKLKYGIEVIREMENLPLINAYEDELAQVWTNLLHNAIQAIEVKGKIYLTTQEQDDKILVSIKDTGKGIPDEVQQKIFDAFFTTKPAGEGSGLGLNIVRKIIEKHDGKIWFETENIGKNTGTTFFVELPIK